MQSLLANVPVEQRGGFWSRQSNANVTSKQIVFDVFFGILMPLVCFYFDPGIVRRLFQTSVGGFSIFIYAFSGLAIVALILWFVVGSRTTPFVRAGFGGVLLAGATVSFAIGVLILPLTLLGILFVVGVLGLVPFVTGYVYLRNGARAIGIDTLDVNRTPHIASAVLIALIALGLPGVAQWRINASINQSLAEIADVNSESIDAPLARIKRFHFFIDTDRIVQQYENETNSVRQERLGRAYREITGEDIKTRLMIMKD